MNYSETLAYKKRIEADLFETPGIFAVGIGLDSKSGEDEYKIVVYSTKKSAVQALRLSDVSNNDNISIDYIIQSAPSNDILYLNEKGEEEYHVYNQSGSEIAYTPPCKDFNKYNPLIGGIQLYLRDNNGWFGTLGAIVQSKTPSDTKKYLLSNHHVFCRKGLQCFQPDGNNRNVIGKVVFDTDFSNTDAALAVLNDNIEWGNNLIQDIGEISDWAKAEKSILGKRVLKRGRTTLVTEGTINTISTRIKIGNIYRDDCVIVKADPDSLFSASGDSGSPVILKENHKLVGLHFAGNNTFGGISVFCAIENVFNNLNVKLIQ